ncbi:MAG TPA: lipoyl(octanoyl) transferase LipB [Halothiobacillus sp.]|nr:lipoyl(octanoyl) transferase LipB [Halothiobacillus sp.]
MIIRALGTQCDYADILAQMQAFTAERDAATPDEFWLLSHAPIFTQGLNGQPAHVLDAGDIPVVRTDRGGQVTYHGPGQLVLYTLIDLKRAGMGVREWVQALEQSVIDFMAERGVLGARKEGAPGVYVAGAKIAALGLKVRQGRCYHGLAFNLDMDLTPFARINPCGMAHLPVTQWRACYAEFNAADASINAIGHAFARTLNDRLNGLNS